MISHHVIISISSFLKWHNNNPYTKKIIVKQKWVSFETWPEILHTKWLINDSYHCIIFNRNIRNRQGTTYYGIAKL